MGVGDEGTTRRALRGSVGEHANEVGFETETVCGASFTRTGILKSLM